MNRTLPAFCLLLFSLLAAPVLAQGVSRPVADEISAILQNAANDQARERAAYGSLANGEVLAAKQRQLDARVGRELTGVVIREATYDRRRGQEAAAYIARVAPAFGNAAYQAAQNYAAPAPAALPAAWYPPAGGYGPASPPIRPTVYQAGPPAGRPGQWYDSPVLARYGYGPQPASFAPPPANVGLGGMGQPMPGLQQPLFQSGTTPSGNDEIWDPLEPVNRAFFAFNEVVDTFLLRPVAWLYSFAPDAMKTGFRNAFANLKSPATLMNNTLQGNFSDAATTVGRFAVNSTVGVLGLWDAADSMLDWKAKPADFGQTLHGYGVGEGPFLMVPILGPTNTRDGVGNAVDSFADPLMYILNDNARMGLAAGRALVRREELLKPLDELKAGSVDYYASLRAASQLQRRAYLRGGSAPSAAGRKANDDLFNQSQ